MRKLNWYVISLALFFFLLPFHAKKYANSSELRVTVGGDNTNSVVMSRVVDSLNDQDNGLFKSIINDSKITIPYARLGEIVNLTFTGKTPVSYELKESILNKDGAIKTPQRSIHIQFTNGSASFNLSENNFSFLSSNIKDYEFGASIRGYRLICKWEDRMQEYAFIIRTDTYK